jgi:hypothetical protein
LKCTKKFRYEEGDFTEEARTAAMSHMYQFAQLWEELVGERGCTFNLHLLICRLFEQEAARGHVSFALEFWVETQLIQYLKSDVKYRTTGCPELIFVNGLMIDWAVAQMRTAPNISDWDSSGAPWSSAGMRGTAAAAAAAWDGGGVQSGTKFQALGRGKMLPSGSDQHSAALALWGVGEGGRKGYLQECQGAVIGEDWRQLLEGEGEGVVAISEFARACKEGGDEFQSELHSRARKKESFWAVCSFQEGEEEEEVQYVARVLRFLKFSCADREDLRAAEVQLYRCVEEAPGVFKVADFGTGVEGVSFWPSYMVPLPCFAFKVFHCDTSVGSAAGVGSSASHFFVRYTVFSRTIGGEVLLGDGE